MVRRCIGWVQRRPPLRYPEVFWTVPCSLPFDPRHPLVISEHNPSLESNPLPSPITFSAHAAALMSRSLEGHWVRAHPKLSQAMAAIISILLGFSGPVADKHVDHDLIWLYPVLDH